MRLALSVLNQQVELYRYVRWLAHDPLPKQYAGRLGGEEIQAGNIPLVCGCDHQTILPTLVYESYTY